MIRGTVNDRREGVVGLRLRGPSGSESDVEAVVDTAFTGTLALPTPVIELLGLEQEYLTDVTLADGSTSEVSLYSADVEWGDDWQNLLIYATEGGALVGMMLLDGYELRIAVVPGGAVEITPLP